MSWWSTLKQWNLPDYFSEGREQNCVGKGNSITFEISLYLYQLSDRAWARLDHEKAQWNGPWQRVSNWAVIWTRKFQIQSSEPGTPSAAHISLSLNLTLPHKVIQRHLLAQQTHSMLLRSRCDFVECSELSIQIPVYLPLIIQLCTGRLHRVWVQIEWKIHFRSKF